MKATTCRHVAVAVGALAVVLGARSADAQRPRDDVATANALFTEGRRLAADGDFPEACAKFETSMKLAPRLGVQLNLADCYEQVGKTASAWVAFGEAAALARQLGDSREEYARERQRTLVAHLSRISIAAAPSVEGLVVTRDGAPVASSAYGVEIPVDPGVHVVDATAPDRIPWTARIVVPSQGELVKVEIPALPRGASRAAVVTASGSPSRRMTPAMWAASGVGVVGLGVGTAYGLAARSLWRDAQLDCNPSRLCTDAGYARVERARRDGNLSTGAFVLSGAALITGTVLYLQTRRGRDRTARLLPALAPTTAGLLVLGIF